METSARSGSARWLWPAFFFAVTLALAAGCYAYYRSETNRIREEKYQEIAAIAQLKAGQIQEWRQERLRDIGRSSKAPFFNKAVREWLRDLNNTLLTEQLRHRLVIVQKEEGYADVLLLDTGGRILLSAIPDPHSLSPTAKQIIEEAVANRTALLSDLYRSLRGVVHVDAVAPILDPEGQPTAVLLLRSNAEDLLFPLIQSWPTPSRTAETIIVRREGEDILYLNKLRHRPDSALSLREPLTLKTLPAVQAALGRQGMFQGRDYRGVEVLADLRAIPESPWFMVTKVDAGEILAEARYRGGVIALFSVLFILLAAGVTAYGYRYREVRLYRDLYRSERERRVAHQEFRTTLYSIGDAVITTDTAGLVRHMNPVAERLTGWQETEASGKPLDEVFHIVNEDTCSEVENPVHRVLREGAVLELANHTLLMAKDGSERPIADSGAPIRDESGAITGVVLVFRDRTEEREAQNALKESAKRYRDLWERAPVMMISLDSQARIIYASDHFCEELGYDRGEVLGRRPFEFQTEDSARYAQSVVFPSFLKTGRVKDEPLQFVKKNGGVMDVLLNVTAERDAQGNIVRSRSVFTDMTDHKWTEAALRTSEAQLSNALEMAHLGHWEYDVTKDLFTFNDHFYKIFRTTAEQVGGYTMSSADYARRFVHPDDISVVADETRNAIEADDAGFSRQLEHRMLYADGEIGHISVRFFIVKDDQGRTVKTYGVNQDITERRGAEQAIRESEERYRSLFEHMLDGYAYCRMFFEDGEPQDFVYLDVNEAFERLTGLKNVVGKKVTEVIPGVRESNPELFEVYGRVALTGNPEKLETCVKSLGIWLSISVYSTEKEHFVAVFDNITERRLADELLRQAEQRYRRLFEDAPLMYVITRNEQGVPFVSDCNELFLKSLDYSREKIVGHPLADFYSPESRFALVEGGGYARALAGGFFMGERQLLTRGGRLIPTLLYTATEVDTAGQVIGTRAMFVDITERREAEAALRFEREQLLSIFESINEMILVIDPRTYEILYANKFAEDLYGKKLTGRNCYQELSSFDSPCEHCAIDSVMELQGKPYQWEYRSSALERDFLATDRMIRWPDGRDVKFQLAIDITERKRAEEEKENLSSQLLQAQKMEAVGTLAGGVAHDFNNLLQVVLGYSELILSDEHFPAAYRADLERINQAAGNGADLVRGLLTFSRKTEFNPRPLNLNRRIEQLQKMLSRTISKMIEIDLILADDLAAINADPSQMEQVLMNLTVNARDAMPEGGRLTIQTENVTLDEYYCETHLQTKPGRYVLLSVSDTGHGMNKETVQHIFEPFFTTKGPGEGTGLGLAMVYGIVKQHDGHITCYSEPVKGTTFKMYFPALVSDEELRVTEARAIPPGGSETILIVDDEELIRDLASRILTKAGYKVIAVSDGNGGLEVYRARSHQISLVLLDLMMPEMGGERCVEELLKINPEAKVLIASGYSLNGSTKEALRVAVRGFVDKPYDVRQLLETVRDVLDS